MKKFITIVFLVLIILSTFILINLYGTPWGRYFAKKEVETYLRTTYKENMIINDKDSYYDFKNLRTYIFIVSPETNQDISFPVRKIENKYYDNYPESVIEYQISQELKNEFQKYYSDDCDIIVTTNIKNKDLDNINTINIDKYKKDLYNFNILILIKRPYTSDTVEYENKYNIIKYLQDNDFNPDYVRFTYNLENENKKSFSYSYINKINSVEDLIYYDK